MWLSLTLTSCLVGVELQTGATLTASAICSACCTGWACCASRCSCCAVETVLTGCMTGEARTNGCENSCAICAGCILPSPRWNTTANACGMNCPAVPLLSLDVCCAACLHLRMQWRLGVSHSSPGEQLHVKPIPWSVQVPSTACWMLLHGFAAQPWVSASEQHREFVLCCLFQNRQWQPATNEANTTIKHCIK